METTEISLLADTILERWKGDSEGQKDIVIAVLEQLNKYDAERREMLNMDVRGIINDLDDGYDVAQRLAITAGNRPGIIMEVWETRWRVLKQIDKN